MSEEIFDVVNERDEPVDRLPRRRVHELGLRHRATHILAFNSRGELFLQQRSLTKDMWPGVWDSSASGHLDAGEDYDACAIREIGEELGVTISAPPRRWFKLEASPATGMEFCWVYRWDFDGPFRLQESEIRGGGWFRPEMIASWLEHHPEDFGSAFRIIWERLRSPG